MLCHLDRKLWRDLRRMKGQAIAVALVMACGLAMMIMARSLIYSLESTRQEYYEANRFADVFALLKRAPNSLAARVAEIPGVATVQPGISVQVTLDIPSLDEPASGMVRSLPDFGPPELNRLFLRAGRWLAPGSRGEVLVGRGLRRGQPPAARRHHRHAAQRQAPAAPHRRHRAVARVHLRIAARRGAAGQPHLRHLLDALQGTGHGVRPRWRVQLPRR